MERIELVKSVRISQKLVGTLSIFYALLNLIMNLVSGTYSELADVSNYFRLIILIINYIALGSGGILLLRRQNWAIYLIAIPVVIDFIIVVGDFLFLLMIFDVVLFILCIQFLNNYKKYQAENAIEQSTKDRSDESLTLD